MFEAFSMAGWLAADWPSTKRRRKAFWSIFGPLGCKHAGLLEYWRFYTQTRVRRGPREASGRIFRPPGSKHGSWSAKLTLRYANLTQKGARRKPRGVRRQGRRANWPGSSRANLRPRYPQEGSRSAPVGLQRAS